MRSNNCWKWKAAVVSLFLAALLIWPMGGGAQLLTVTGTETPAATTFSGQARAVRATVLGLTTILADTGTVADSGDARDATSLAGSIPNVLSAEALHATAIAGEFAGQHRSDSEASLGGLAIGVGGNTISADFVMGRVAAICTDSGPSLLAASSLSGLRVNGIPVEVTGAPNQTVPFLGGQVVINEQTLSGGTGTVNALHVLVDGIADVVVSSAQAGVTCGS